MISSKTISAVEVCLAIAQMQALGPVTGAALSERLKLSISHLENILKQLKQRRIIVSARGPGGGYTLGQAPEQTTLWDIAAVFEKTLQDSEKIGEPNTVAARYEWGLEGVVVAYLKGIVMSDVLDTSGLSPKSLVVSQAMEIQLRQPSATPPVPNSVFQWHLAA
jgi:Rrf2 family iron-sulfur cluster assembly transcriptional regulator